MSPVEAAALVSPQRPVQVIVSGSCKAALLRSHLLVTNESEEMAGWNAEDRANRHFVALAR
jgi:hypothetical protein